MVNRFRYFTSTVAGTEKHFFQLLWKVTGSLAAKWFLSFCTGLVDYSLELFAMKTAACCILKLKSWGKGGQNGVSFNFFFCFLNKSSNQMLWHLPWHNQIVVHEAAVISFCSQSTTDLLLLLFLLFSLFISLNNTNYLILTFTQTHSLSWPKAHSVQLLTSPGSGGMTSPYHLLRAHGKGGWGG